MAPIDAVAFGQSALRVRRTFIDVDESPEDVRSSARRTRSAPSAGDRDSAASAAVHQEQLDLLAEKLTALWRRREDREAASPHRSAVATRFCSPGSGARVPNGAPGDAKPRAKLFDFQSQDDSATATEHGTPTTDRSSSPATPFAFVANCGSIGHPAVCSRPCLFFAKGECANGSSCEFCHLPHPRKPMTLDKKHREILREMPSWRAKALVLPVLRQRMLTLDSSVASHRAFDAFAGACAAETAARVRPTRGERALLGVLHTMGFRLLLSAFQRTVLQQGDAQAEAAATELIQHLRDAAAAAADPTQVRF